MRRLTWLVCVVVGLWSACSAPQDGPATEPQRLWAAAQEARGAGDRAQTINLCSQVLALDPDFYPAYLCRGLARESSGDRQGAFADYATAREMRLNAALGPLTEACEAADAGDSAFYARGVEYMRFSQWAKAYADFERAAAENPDNLLALYRLSGLAAARRAGDEAARDQWARELPAAGERCLARGGDGFARALRVQAAIVRNDGWEQAEADATYVFEHAAEHPEAACFVAVHLLALGAADPALRFIDAALAGDPDPLAAGDLRRTRWSAHLGAGDTAAAVADADEMVRADPMDSEAYLARCQARIGCLPNAADPAANKTKAFDDAYMAVALAPDSAEALYVRGVCREATGDAAGAQLDKDEAFRLDPGLEGREIFRLYESLGALLAGR